ncbi:MAG TPA: hypothetical protein VFT98_11885, partial [Myxococcota bacterium]|nr:hypothetical protein [Myxococcota bacterium]
MDLITSRWSQVPRRWSNRQLRRYAHLFDGDVVNVSGWRDEDKEGAHYRDYFTTAASYSITNWKSDARGLQGTPGEIFLDLEQPLRDELVGRFDVVFNHTVLEHIYECRVAFRNLCQLSRDVVIAVVPFLQPYHSDYGDFWRFTPLSLHRMYTENGLALLACNFNEDWLASVYLFAIGSRHPERWAKHFPEPFSLESSVTGEWPGARAIPKV